MTTSNLYRGDYIQGRFSLVGQSNGEIVSRNPANLDDEPLRFPFAFDRVPESIAAAKQAFVNWRRTSSSDRLTLLEKYKKQLTARRDQLEAAVCWEVGKPRWEAKQEVGTILNFLELILRSKWGANLEESLTLGDDDALGVVRHFPRGVTVVIAPSAVPLAMAHFQFLPALSSGNTVVFKAPKHAPLSAQIVAECFHEVGTPAGVFNLMHGDSESARRLVAHSDVDTVMFTGSSEAGSKIAKQIGGDYWKNLVLELGGKNSILVWEDCHYKKALHDSVLSAFITTGQRCTSADRILVHEKIFDRFLEDFHKLSKAIKVGWSLEDGPETAFMGPMVSEEALEHYLRIQTMAVREGCEEIMRGKTLERKERGYFVSPSIHWVKEANPKSMYQRNPVHGPDVGIYRISDLGEAADIINQTSFGMVSSIYCASKPTYLQMVGEIRVGLLNWNRPTTDVSFQIPYGGVKKSGSGRSMGSMSLQQCTFAMSSLEHQGTQSLSHLPSQLPKLED